MNARAAKRSPDGYSRSIEDWKTRCRTCSVCSASSKATIRWRRWTAQIRKRRTLEAIKRIVLRESLNQPLMVIFEDLHWIDEATQELLEPAGRLASGPRRSYCWSTIVPNTHISGAARPTIRSCGSTRSASESAEEMLTALLGDGIEADAAQAADHREDRRQSVLHGRDGAGAVRRGRAGAQRQAVKLTRSLNAAEDSADGAGDARRAHRPAAGRCTRSYCRRSR